MHMGHFKFEANFCPYTCLKTQSKQVTWQRWETAQLVLGKVTLGIYWVKKSLELR